MPISLFWYEEFYMDYIGDIFKTHRFFKKSLLTGKTTGRTPSSTPHTLRHPQTWSLQSLPHPLISWFIQTTPPNKRRLDRPKTTLCGLVFSRANSHHHSKVRRPSTSSTTTHTTTISLVHPNPTDNQTIELGRRMKTKSPLNPNRRVGWRKLRRGRLNLGGG